MVQGKFNIRVYGILVNQYQQVLVSDELIRGNYFTKFPGGGLEFGEGTRDCLQREFLEETGLTVNVDAHIYTTDFFQISAFNNSDQIISIYYFVSADAVALEQLRTSNQPFAFSAAQKADIQGQYESFRWIDASDFQPAALSLPIDKIVVDEVRKQLQW
jgi:ADP-ribose pyrophosphatase YjhB (NUDIX family)